MITSAQNYTKKMERKKEEKRKGERGKKGVRNIAYFHYWSLVNVE